MVRKDDFFLSRWVEYYGQLLGKENLFIYFDGEDQSVPACAQSCNVQVIPRVDGNVRVSDKERINILSARASQLLESYDMIIGTDVDEFLVVDPVLHQSLPEFLSAQNIKGHNSLSGLGCDIIFDPGRDSVFDRSMPLLSQRRAALLSTRYTKSSVLCAPVRWGSGFHRTRRGDFHICKGLYLFHFGCADPSIIAQKMQDKDLASRGWHRHLSKRRRLSDSLPSIPFKDWDEWTVKARKLQSWIRLPYTWNKPAMLNMKIRVLVPERFGKIV